ncbi:hypothetical protein [Actinomadura rupiterrae]|uniref:hypothetical protein n=1 Tax=Actinomadura rupiterrae TaxID=559627 RepID=UPI0020A4036A|nr:hypothetical protein [Actinomadura rupiterrae]MCP2339142.1 hypothetical protein [Actinomadura rupiterrae]
MHTQSSYPIRPPNSTAAEPRQQPQQYPTAQFPAQDSGRTLILIIAVFAVVMAWKRHKTTRVPIVAALIVGLILAGSVFGPTALQTISNTGGQVQNAVNGIQGPGYSNNPNTGNGNGGGGTP